MEKGCKAGALPGESSDVVLPVTHVHVDSVRAGGDKEADDEPEPQGDLKRSRKSPRKETNASQPPTGLEQPQSTLNSHLLSKLHEEQARSAALIAERAHIEDAARSAVQHAVQHAQLQAHQEVAEARETAEQAVASTIIQVQQQAEARQKCVEEQLAAEALKNAYLQEKTALLESGRADVAEQLLQKEAEKHRVIEGEVLLLRQQLVERDGIIDKLHRDHNRV